MSNLAEVNNQVSAQVSAEQMELIKRTVAKGATNDELQMFLHLAQAYNLDPFAKEIWFIKYDGRAPTIMTSRDGYLKIAQSHEDYEGLISFPVREGDNFEIDAMNYTVTHKFGAKRGHILGAWAKCERKDCKPMIAFVDFTEYNDANSPVWKKYPSAMIQKVAEVFVLKRQFGISGLTTKEEMSTDFDLKNVTEHKPESAEYMTANEVPQIPQQVGDYMVSINRNQMKLSDLDMKKLVWLKNNSKIETTRAMASARIDEIEFKRNKAEVEADALPVMEADALMEDKTAIDVSVAADDPTALFGGAAV